MNTIQSYRILIWSEDPDSLITFYRDILGLEQVLKYELPDDYGYAFNVGSSMPIWIGKHSEVIGKNKEPFRHMINLYVDDVNEWYEKLKDREDIAIVQEPMVTPPTRGSEDEKHVFTLLDPEGNCLQFMEPM